MTTYSFQINGATEATVISLKDTPFSEAFLDSIPTEYIRVTAKKVVDGLLLDELHVREARVYHWWIETQTSDTLMGLWHLEIEDDYIEIRRIHSLVGDPAYDGDLEITISVHNLSLIHI